MKKKWNNPLIYNHTPNAVSGEWSGEGSSQGTPDDDVFWGYEQWCVVYDWPDLDEDGDGGTWEDYLKWVEWYNETFKPDPPKEPEP